MTAKLRTLTAASLAVGILMVGAASPSSAEAATKGSAEAVTKLPAECNFRLTGVTKGGHIVRHEMRQGKLTSNTYKPGTIGFVPTSLNHNMAGGNDFIGETYFATSPAGKLYLISASAKTGYEDVNITKRALSSKWRSIRALDDGSAVPGKEGHESYIYGLTKNGGLNRYETDFVKTPDSRTVVAKSGWRNVETITWTRRTGAGASAADVFIGTMKSGALVEYTVPLKHPGQWTRTALKKSSWDDTQAIATGSCWKDNEEAGRIIVRVDKDGTARGYYDKDREDGSGTDITSYGKLATKWADTIYS